MTMGNPKLNIKQLKSAPENHSDIELSNVIGMIDKDVAESVDDGDQMNDFDEKMDQHSYIEQKRYPENDDSEFDDGGFLSDEVDERRSITPNLQQEEFNLENDTIDQNASFLNISKISKMIATQGNQVNDSFISGIPRQNQAFGNFNKSFLNNQIKPKTQQSSGIIVPLTARVSNEPYENIQLAKEPRVKSLQRKNDVNTIYKSPIRTM